MFLALHDLFVELRAFLPFLTVHTENAAMIHDFLRVKYHTLRIVLMQHIDSQTSGIQFQRPFSGDREHPIIEVAVFLHIRCGYLLIRHRVFIQRLLLCFRQLRRSSHLTGLCLHLLVGSFLQGLNHGQRRVFYRVSAQIVVITNLENCLHAGNLRHIQLTTIQLFHGRGIVKGIVPAAVTGLDMKIGGIVNQKQSLLLVGIRPQHFHFRHCRSQFLYRFLHQRIITVIVDCLDGVQVNGLAGQNRKRSFIVASVFQLKTNALDPVHSLCWNLLINADSFLQRQVIVVFSEVWKFHALCYIVGQIAGRQPIRYLNGICWLLYRGGFRLYLCMRVDSALFADFLIVALNVGDQSAGGFVDGLQTGSQLFQFLALTPTGNIAKAIFSSLDAKIFADCIGDAFSLHFFRVTVFDCLFFCGCIFLNCKTPFKLIFVHITPIHIRSKLFGFFFCGKIQLEIMFGSTFTLLHNLP